GVSFNESDVLRAFSPQGNVTATPGLTIKVWYNDEHALTLGVRQVVVKSRTGTTTTDYPFSSLPKNPGSVLYPQVGTTALDGAQVRWNVDDLVAGGRMIYGHTYRMQFMVHDGDQNKAGGDSGEFCVNVKVACGSASTCNDGDACTTDTCDAGVCHNTAIAGCKKCTSNTNCNDGNACTTESGVAGPCATT